MQTKTLVKVARQELEEWSKDLPRGLVISILFCFIHRVTTGETVEETFFKDPTIQPDYEI